MIANRSKNTQKPICLLGLLRLQSSEEQTKSLGALPIQKLQSNAKLI